ncbi:MAG: YicC/YloC family endoribonuclease [Kiritimatiellia bacterium]
MKSMTGFGQAQLNREGLTIQVEISSVNRKNLDLHFSLPRGLAALEARCQRLIASQCVRGRVQTRVLLESSAPAGKMTLNRERAGEWLAQLNRFAEEQGLEPLRSVAEVLRFPRVFEELETAEEDSGDVWPDLEKVLTQAVADLMTMRTAEGAHLKKVLSGLRQELSDLVKQIHPLLPEARQAQSAKIKEAVSGIGNLSAEMQNRLLQEIALQAEKSDVQEELDRLEGHLQQMAVKLDQSEPVGRALDFLCQEMSRELNTLSVKASSAEINRLALEGKECVEKIREQVQNVE